jgi:hypothetical protein
MDAKTAISIIGTSAQPVAFANMIRALQMMPRLNTPEENRRLEAALWVRRNRKAFDAACAELRNARGKGAR